jgi:hypothetical protein
MLGFTRLKNGYIFNPTHFTSDYKIAVFIQSKIYLQYFRLKLQLTKTETIALIHTKII